MIVAAEVAAALAERRPVVALESTIISHGLPRPDNLAIAGEIEQAVRDGGAVPATVAILAGQPHVGLDPDELHRIATGEAVKASVRDLAVVAARGLDGATTVAATAHLAARAGIAVFATGGLGGVHREARDTWDESADLTTLSRTSICVVCAGVKSILDVPATLERLETLNIAVIGYRTDRFPGFYLPDSGHPVPWRVDSAAEVARVLHRQRGLGVDAAVLLANPVAADHAVPIDVHADALATGLAAARAADVTGKDVTPFLLDHFHRSTAGASLTANVELVKANARLAAEVAVAFSH